MPFTIRIVINVTGMDELIANSGIIDSYIMEHASEEIQGGAQQRAAVKTGFMKRNIDREVEQSRFRVIARAGYSGFVNYGTRYMRAQPFMEPSAEAVDYDGIAQDALKQAGY